MSPARIAVLTALALLAFAGNSLLCRTALSHTYIDAATFTAVRLVSGALMLWALVALRRSSGTGTGTGKGSLPSALALLS